LADHLKILKPCIDYLYNKNNDIEGHRIRIGGKTNYEFSERTSLGGYIAYGTKDEAIKYGIEVDHLINRKPWTTLHIERRYDVEPLDVVDEANRKTLSFRQQPDMALLQNPTSLLITTSAYNVTWYGAFPKIGFTHEKFQPLFPFGYLEQPNQNTDIIEDFKTSEFVFETWLSRDEQFIVENNIRHSLGTLSAPIFIFQYRLGVSNLLGSQLDDHKFSLRMIKTLGMGLLGKSLYTIKGGYIPTTLPFPLLQNHI